MTLLGLLRGALQHGEDALADYRNDVARQISALATLLLTPFTLINLWQGHLTLAALIFATQAILMINVRALDRGRKAPVPFEVLTVVLSVAICTAVHVLGLRGVFWAYPGLFIIYFVLLRRTAFLLSLVLVSAATVLIHGHMGFAVAARVGATLLLTLLMINVVLNVIGELQSALVAQAITDPLTGAFNRRHLHAQLDRLAGEGPSVAHALLAIDIDHFKRINDEHGHDVGDRVLQQTVALVAARKRRSDLLFRTGGEEFVLLLPGAALTDARKVAEDIRAQVERAELLPGRSVTVSIGVSAHAPAQASEQWVKAADAALYEAKRGGRNRVVEAVPA
jgi:diguanylate cyclase (GGDEF)-like protein